MYTDLTYSVGGFLQDISSEGSKGSALSRWRITGEDPLHVRKALGILCLASFLWRFGQIGDTTDMGFASHPNLTVRLPTLLLHLSSIYRRSISESHANESTSGYRI
jgi:hypothetical protein